MDWKFTHQFGVQMGAHLGFKLVGKLLMLFYPVDKVS